MSLGVRYGTFPQLRSVSQKASKTLLIMLGASPTTCSISWKTIVLRSNWLQNGRAQNLSQVFQFLVILGDGTAKDLLPRVSAASYDAVATLTESMKYHYSMFLESLGIHKNITKVNRTSLRDYRSTWDNNCHPKSIAVDTVMHFVRGRFNAKDSSLDAFTMWLMVVSKPNSKLKKIKIAWKKLSGFWIR